MEKLPEKEKENQQNGFQTKKLPLVCVSNWTFRNTIFGKFFLNKMFQVKEVISCTEYSSKFKKDES